MTILPLHIHADNHSNFTVVLDAGHGGKDPGAIGSVRTNREKDINLAIALEVGRLLENNCSGMKVLYTRKTDVFVALDRRADIANKAKADLFISFHVNALPKNARKASGVQSYTLTLKTAGTNLEVEKQENSVIQYEEDGASKYSFANPNSAESDIMFALMQDRDMKASVDFAKMAQNEMVRTAGRHDMGVLQANLAVLRLTYMPSVLLEVGYISTPSEEQFLMSDYGRRTMAKSIYNAVVKYWTSQTGMKAAFERPDPQPTTSTVQPTATQHSAVEQQPASSTVVNEAESTVKPSTPPFRIQILSGAVKLRKGDPQFKGLDVDMHKDGKMYRYTYGRCATRAEALKLRKTILDKFPSCFVVQYDE